MAAPYGGRLPGAGLAVRGVIAPESVGEYPSWGIHVSARFDDPQYIKRAVLSVKAGC